MALDTLSSTELLNFIIYDTISATPSLFNNLNTTTAYETPHTNSTPTHVLLEHNILNDIKPPPPLTMSGGSSSSLENTTITTATTTNSSLMRRTSPGTKASGGGDSKANLAVQQGRKKRRRRPRVCKNKEEAETQRMTHIAVERNRRKQMNEHLAVLRSLMPESYVQRGDQASIVGGAIEFVKELEHLLQSLEAQKLQQLQEATLGLASNQNLEEDSNENNSKTTPQQEHNNNNNSNPPPFAQFFLYPQYTWSQIPHKYTSTGKPAIADIEVTLIETHANLRILSRKSPRQLSRLVAGFQTLHMTILHLNVTTTDPLVLYSISAKIEEGCQLTSVDDIAGAVHHMLRIIEEGDAIC